MFHFYVIERMTYSFFCVTVLFTRRFPFDVNGPPKVFSVLTIFQEETQNRAVHGGKKTSD